MHIKDIGLNHWFGNMTSSGIVVTALVEELQKRLQDKVVVLIIDNPACNNLEMYSDQRLERADGFEGVTDFSLNLRFTDYRLSISVSTSSPKPYFVINGDEITVRWQRWEDERDYRIYIRPQKFTQTGEESHE